jgi:hypothetical protein
MAMTKFDPQVHGFSFRNSWDFDDVEREQFRSITEGQLIKLREKGGAVLGWLAALVARRAITPIRDRLEEGLGLGYGLCGGMSYAALDFFYSGIDVPWDADPGDRPASGTRLRGYLWKRQLRSFFRDLDRFLAWMIWLKYAPAWWPFLGGPARLVRQSRAEWTKLRASIDAGHPIPLGLVRDSTSIFDNHQVLAIGYDVEDEEHGTIYVYDPNCPGRQSTIRVGFAGTVLQAEESCPAKQALRGFFCEHYEPEEPRGGVSLVRASIAKPPLETRCTQKTEHDP